MKTHAELDKEIIRENVAVHQQERSVYRWSRVKDREERNAAIMEKWALGWSREEIAEHYDLTPARISQIVTSFGCGWR